MATFSYKGRSADGKLVSGHAPGESIDQVAQRLLGTGVTPLENYGILSPLGIDRFNLLCLWAQDPQGDALFGRMRAEYGEGIAVATCHQCPDRMITLETPPTLSGARHSALPWIRSSSPMIGILTQSGRFESS